MRRLLMLAKASSISGLMDATEGCDDEEQKFKTFWLRYLLDQILNAANQSMTSQ